MNFPYRSGTSDHHPLSRVVAKATDWDRGRISGLSDASFGGSRPETSRTAKKMGAFSAKCFVSPARTEKAPNAGRLTFPSLTDRKSGGPPHNSIKRPRRDRNRKFPASTHFEGSFTSRTLQGRGRIVDNTLNCVEMLYSQDRIRLQSHPIFAFSQGNPAFFPILCNRLAKQAVLKGPNKDMRTQDVSESCPALCKPNGRPAAILS